MNALNNGDSPAAPCLYVGFERSGLTKREHFAAMAMQGLCANQTFLSNIRERDPQDRDLDDLVSIASLEMADALLAALEKS